MNNQFDPAMLDAVKKLQLKDGDLLVVPESIEMSAAHKFMEAIKYVSEPDARIALVTGDVSTLNIYSDEPSARRWEVNNKGYGWPICLDGEPIKKKELVERANSLESAKAELVKMLIEIDEICMRDLPHYAESNMVSNGIGHKVFMTIQRNFY